MKNLLKSLVLSAIVVVGGAALAAAKPGNVLVKTDPHGNAAPPLYGGYSYTYLNSTSETMVCTGKCLLAAVLMGTGPSTSYLALRDTASADGASSNYIRKAIQFMNQNTQPASNNPIALPIVVSNGISAKLNNSSNGEEVTVLWVDLNP